MNEYRSSSFSPYFHIVTLAVLKKVHQITRYYESKKEYSQNDRLHSLKRLLFSNYDEQRKMVAIQIQS